MALIWIVEDDPKIGLLIEMTMKKAGHSTNRMANGSWLDITVSEADPLPDLLLLDLMLPGKSGYQILEEWKADQRTRDIPVIIISARSTEKEKVHGLELGAEDYMTKPFGVLELQARVNTALRRRTPSPERRQIGRLTLIDQTHDTFLDRTRIDLTAMEYSLLSYLAKHADETVSRGVLLREVWGYQSDEDLSRTVDSHIKTLRMKLGDPAGHPVIIQTVRGVGYRLSLEGLS